MSEIYVDGKYVPTESVRREYAEWEVSAYGDSFICPCGDEIELDGECAEGHVSPMREMGLI